MDYNTKNHRHQGGDSIHIGGEVVITAGAKVTVEPGAVIEGLPGEDLTAAASQADSNAVTAEELTLDFNSLLARLRSAGLMGS